MIVKIKFMDYFWKVSILYHVKKKIEFDYTRLLFWNNETYFFIVIWKTRNVNYKINDKNMHEYFIFYFD